MLTLYIKLGAADVVSLAFCVLLQEFYQNERFYTE